MYQSDEQQSLTTTQYSNNLIQIPGQDLWERLYSMPTHFTSAFNSTIAQLRKQSEHVSDEAFHALVELRMAIHHRNHQGPPVSTQPMPLQNQRPATHTYSRSSHSGQAPTSRVSKHDFRGITLVGSSFFTLSSQHYQALQGSSSNLSPPSYKISYFNRVSTEPNQSNSRGISLKQPANIGPKKKKQQLQQHTSTYLRNHWIGMDDYRDRRYFEATMHRKMKIDGELYEWMRVKFEEEDEFQCFKNKIDHDPQVFQVNFLRDHCEFCFEALYSFITKGRTSPILRTNLQEFNAPFYVRWIRNHKTRGKQVGSYRPSSVKKNLGIRALYAAELTKPIEVSDLNDLTVQITWVSKVFHQKTVFDWKLNISGIAIDQEIDGIRYDSYFLPRTIIQNKWTKKEAVRQLLKTAGYQGDIAAIAKKIRLTAFEVQTKDLRYEDTTHHWQNERRERHREA